MCNIYHEYTIKNDIKFVYPVFAIGFYEILKIEIFMGFFYIMWKTVNSVYPILGIGFSET